VIGLAIGIPLGLPGSLSHAWHDFKTNSGAVPQNDLAARFGSDQVSFSKKFLRIPLVPHSVGLYATELKGLMLNGELRNTLRLSLLPCLATAAALEFKITGSDKGIW